MYYLLLTKSTTFLIGPIATLLGYIMDAIFNVLYAIGIPNIGISIILFTILVNLLLLPLTIKQQHASKLNSVIMPEVQAVQNKYKGRTDQEAALKMNDETKAIYAKYGSSPTGGCLTSFIQLPILFALYQVIYKLPAYVMKLKAVYETIVNALTTAYPNFATDSAEKLAELAKNARYVDKTALTAGNSNAMIDLMYNFNADTWTKFTDLFPNIADTINQSRASIDSFNSFLGINLAQNPGFAFPIILIPILAGVLQWLSVKLTSASMQTSSSENSTAQTMNMMNNIMPLMSVVFCFMLPAGVGLYWVASSGVRVIIQLFVNDYMKKVDLDQLVEKNVAKLNKKRAKQGLPPVKPSKVSEIKLHELQETKEEREAREAQAKAVLESKADKIHKNTEYYAAGEANPNSIAAKAAMVQKYNERVEKNKGKNHQK